MASWALVRAFVLALVVWPALIIFLYTLYRVRRIVGNDLTRW